MHQTNRFDPKELEIFTNKHQPFQEIPLLSTFLNYWVTHIVYPNKSKNTFTSYHSMIHAHIIPTIGGYYVNEITSDILSLYIDKKQKNDSGISLCAKTVRAHINMLKQAMKYALELNLIAFNPCNDVVLPKLIKKEATVFTIEDQSAMNCAIDPIWKPNSTLCAYLGNMLGLRISEIAALRIDDLDFDNRTIRIDESLNRVAILEADNVVYRLCFGPTKSKRERVIPVSDEVWGNILIYFNTMPTNLKEDKKALLFINSKGNPMEPRLMRYHFKQFLKKLQITAQKFHSLRHTFATRWIEMQMEVNTLSKILGHASSVITEDCYIHVTEMQLKKQMHNYTCSNIKQLLHQPIAFSQNA